MPTIPLPPPENATKYVPPDDRTAPRTSDSLALMGRLARPQSATVPQSHEEDVFVKVRQGCSQ